MKPMSEVFELPVDHKKLEVYGAGELQGVSYDAAEEHAAHAINNVDALADALQVLLDLACDSGLHNSKAVDIAGRALNAYRGEK